MPLSFLPFSAFLVLLPGLSLPRPCQNSALSETHYRERISINEGWRFMKYEAEADQLIYDIRPEVSGLKESVVEVRSKQLD